MPKNSWTAADDPISATKPAPNPTKLGGSEELTRSKSYGARVVGARHASRAEQAARVKRQHPAGWPTLPAA